MKKINDFKLPKRGPTFSRKASPKNSRLIWGEYGLGGWLEHKLRQHMHGIQDELKQLFSEHREILPRNCHLSTGDVYGLWLHCPNAIADEVERLIKKRHAEFEAQDYFKHYADWLSGEVKEFKDGLPSIYI